jgi:hypothetical protein
MSSPSTRLSEDLTQAEIAALEASKVLQRVGLGLRQGTADTPADHWTRTFSIGKSSREADYSPP